MGVKLTQMSITKPLWFIMLYYGPCIQLNLKAKCIKKKKNIWLNLKDKHMTKPKDNHMATQWSNLNIKYLANIVAKYNGFNLI